MHFNEVVGFSTIKSRLIANVNSGRISHAQLFSGEEGGGNLPLALAYLQYLFCEQKQVDDSCGTCANCLRIAKLEHPDVHFTFPFFPKDNQTCSDFQGEFRKAVLHNPYLDTNEFFQHLQAENKQGNINKSEALNIIKRLSLTTYEGGYKVIVIWCPEFLNITAANSLLKVLEEPPKNTLFLMVSNQPDKLLPTIISRVQLLNLPLLNTDEIANALKQRNADTSLSETALYSAAALADGNMLTAMRNLNVSDTDEPILFVQFRQWMRMCFKPGENMQNLQTWVDEMAKVGREMQKQFLIYCLFMTRQCVLFNYTQDQLLSIRGEELAFLKKFAPFFNERNILEFTHCFDEAYRDVSRNANPKILFLDLSFKAFVLIKK